MPSPSSNDPPDAALLRGLFLFESLSEQQLAELAGAARVVSTPAGWVYREGEPAADFYVLLDGAVALTSRAGGDDVEFVRTDVRGTFGGAFYAYLGDRLPRYTTSMRALTATRLLAVPAEDFGRMLRDWFPMAVHLLAGLHYGIAHTQQATGQREHLQALGALAAGLAHELNNPAAAVARAAASLRDCLAGLDASLTAVAATSHAVEEIAGYLRLRTIARSIPADRDPEGVLASAEREDQVADWLGGHGIDDAWDLAEPLARAGLDREQLEHGWRPPPDASVERVLRWVSRSLEAESLAAEIQGAAARISGLVDAAKSYTQMDRADHQLVDVREGLDSTLAVLADRLDQVTVRTTYDDPLPRVPAEPAALNQVWMHLLDNALDAMGGAGTLAVEVRQQPGAVLVEITDSGPGIPEGILDRIFEPFFTTKPVGLGSGLGLDLAWRVVVNRHHGDIRVASEPGRTRVQVRLPVDPPAEPVTVDRPVPPAR
jgi:signal transduction histidine kinase